MPKIKMLSMSAGPKGTYLPSNVYDVPIGEAKQLIEGGFAVPVKEIYETGIVGPQEQEIVKKVENKGLRKRKSK